MKIKKFKTSKIKEFLINKNIRGLIIMLQSEKENRNFKV